MTPPTEPNQLPPWHPQRMFQTQVDHLVWLAQSPGWLDYARARAKELEADQSGMFVGLYAAIATRMRSATTGVRTPTKPG